MRRLIVTRLAKRDLTSIVGYIGNTSRSVPTAQAFGRKLVDRCNRLAALPGTLGVQRPDFGEDVRAAYHGDYVILFRYETGCIRLLRVMHGQRDLSNQSSLGDT